MITYSPTPQNNLTSFNTPIFQDWGPKNGANNSYQTDVYYAPLSGMPVPSVSVNFQILDVIGNPLYAQYSEFRMFSLSHFQNGTTAFVESASITDIGCPVEGGSTVPITTNGINYTFAPTFKNLELLPYGTQNLWIQRKMQGKTAQGVWQNISTYNYWIYFHTIDAQVYVVPDTLAFQHIQGFTPQTKSFTIYGNTWKIVGNPFFVIDSPTSGVTITSASQTNSGYTGDAQTITGAGTATIEVTPGEYYDLLNPASPEIVRSFALFANGPAFLNAAGLTYQQVSLSNGHVLVREPSELRFSAVIGFSEPDAQYIFFKSTQAYTISASPWLITEVITINQNGVIKTAIKVNPIAITNFNLGLYTGLITISATVDGVPTTVATNIFYSIEDFITLPYSLNKRAFTLDNNEVKFSSPNANTYMQFNMQCRVFDFFTANQTNIDIPQKIVLFKGQSSLNVGKTIHKIMKRFSGVNSNFEQYQLASVNFTCQEKNFSDDTIVRETQSDIIQFVAGLSHPDKDMTILDINLKPNRVTVDSYIYLNILFKLYNGAIVVYKNGVQHEVINLPFSINQVVTKKIYFSEFAQGDVIGFRIDDNIQNRSIVNPVTDLSMLKEYKIFPLGDYSNQIIWENEYLVQSTIDCTGTYKLQTDLEFQSQKLYQQLVEVLEILEINKTVKLTINTGWLMKSDIDTVQSLMSAKRAWLEQENKIINLRPIGKPILNEDSERELIDFTLEFEINKKYNEETYSF